MRIPEEDNNRMVYWVKTPACRQCGCVSESVLRIILGTGPIAMHLLASKSDRSAWGQSMLLWYNYVRCRVCSVHKRVWCEKEVVMHQPVWCTNNKLYKTERDFLVAHFMWHNVVSRCSQLYLRVSGVDGLMMVIRTPHHSDIEYIIRLYWLKGVLQ